MKKLLYLFIATFAFLSVSATELNYKWKANTSYNFNATIVDNISTSAMGMNINEKYSTTVDFTLFIQSVQPNGTATGRMYLTNFNVKNSAGVSVASLLNLPKDAIKSEFQVDKKGNFTFLKKVYLVTTPTSNVMVYANASESGANAGMQVGEEKVDAYAEFDPKTGKLKAGYTVTTIKTPKKVTVKENEESDEIDLFPYDFLSCMAVPEGDLNVNDRFEVKAGMYKIDGLVKSAVSPLMVIEENIATDKNSDMFQGSANGQSGDGSQQFSMEGFGGESQMELTQEDQEAMSMTKSAAPNMDGKLTVSFDFVNGMFSSIKGNINTAIDMMGVIMKVNSVIEMKRK
ncbi:MAG: hypothetical protein FJZ67_10260 [Bacteroidetes bacterium]|nr:hypothetical protein [Bacteroidota bacterium]